MIKLKHTSVGVIVSAEGSTPILVKPTTASTPAGLEDAISQVFKVSAVSHKVRDFVTLEYPKPTKLYIEKEGSTLSIESECGTVAEMTGSLLGFQALLEAAGVPFEN